MEAHSKLTTTELSIGYTHKAKRTTIADALNLSLKAGEFVCLLGPNGAGKSTLIRTLAGMQKPLCGSIQLGGKDVASIAPRQRAKLVSVVLTDTHPAGMMDAYTLVSLGRHPYSGWLGGLNAHDRERVEWAFQAVGAEVLANRQVAELSDGERQKISIARALSQESKVMLLDEPTAFLDLPRRVELMSILRKLAHQESLGLLLSTHDLDLALRFADRLWIMTKDGALIQGYPEALALDGTFAKVFASENLNWDDELGSFKTHRTPCLYVHMAGASIEHIWTRRALERLGYGITSEPSKAAFSIEVRGRAEETTWQLQATQTVQAFKSLSTMIEYLRLQANQ